MTDAIQAGKRLDFVREQLQQYAGKKISQAAYTFIICPYHSEKTPSARVFHSSTTRSPGYMKCYGCGKSVPWNDLAPLLGLKPFGHSRPKDEYTSGKIVMATDELFEEKEQFVREKMKSKPLPKGKKWRSISTELLTDLGANISRFYNTEYKMWTKPRIFLPVMINGELAGYIKGRIKKAKDMPSYVNAKGSWSKTHGLFPYDYSIQLMKKLKSTYIVLVEGPRDALVLLSHGIPAVCILGTQSWSDNKSKLLALGGVEHVVMMMDGDCAGKSATEKIQPLLTPFFDSVEVVRLWALKGSPYRKFADEENPSKAAKEAGVSLWDPASVPTEVLDKVKRKYFEE